ncbi:MAG: zinc ribbon domain-containing protein [Lachnospiraceae bacterium]|nr:zinc ribbon domain-containing protein [Lachnospiraceae bacterium]
MKILEEKKEENMYCTQCGNNIPDGAISCNVCGTPVNQGMGTNQYQQPQQTYQPNQYQQPQQTYQPNQYQQPQQTYQPNQYQQQNMQWNNLQQSAFTQNNGEVLGMKWFKFVIWVQLFLNCILNIYNGYRISMGKHYNVDDRYLQKIYNMFDGLQTIDITVGIMMMALGVYAVITRFFLAGFKKHGPFMYHLCIFFNILVAVIYCILVKATVVGIELNLSSMISNAVVMITLLICNIVYFGKRKHLFIN